MAIVQKPSWPPCSLIYKWENCIWSCKANHKDISGYDSGNSELIFDIRILYTHMCSCSQLLSPEWYYKSVLQIAQVLKDPGLSYKFGLINCSKLHLVLDVRVIARIQRSVLCANMFRQESGVSVSMICVLTTEWYYNSCSCYRIGHKHK